MPDSMHGALQHQIIVALWCQASSAADQEACRLSDSYTNRWFLDPVHPKDMLDHYTKLTGPLDFIRPEDMGAMGHSIDSPKTTVKRLPSHAPCDLGVLSDNAG